MKKRIHAQLRTVVHHVGAQLCTLAAQPPARLLRQCRASMRNHAPKLCATVHNGARTAVTTRLVGVEDNTLQCTCPRQLTLGTVSVHSGHAVCRYTASNTHPHL